MRGRTGCMMLLKVSIKLIERQYNVTNRHHTTQKTRFWQAGRAFLPVGIILDRWVVIDIVHLWNVLILDNNLIYSTSHT